MIHTLAHCNTEVHTGRRGEHGNSSNWGRTHLFTKYTNSLTDRFETGDAVNHIQNKVVFVMVTDGWRALEGERCV